MSEPAAGFIALLWDHPAGLVIFNSEGTVVEANAALTRTLGIRFKAYPFSPTTRTEIAKRLQLDNSSIWGEIWTGNNPVVNREMEFRTDSGEEIAVIVNCSRIDHATEGNRFALASVVNVGDIKAREADLILREQKTAARLTVMEEILESTVRDLDNCKQELQESYQSLESLNYAMKLLMLRLEDQRKDMEERITQNLNLTVQPVLEHMKARDREESPDHLLETLDYNIRHITSLFGIKLAEERYRLSRREIQVCQMIRAGKNTHEIAQALGLSYQTIIVHRKNIRKKLGLTQRKQNLVTFIMQNLDTAHRSRSPR